MKKLIELIPITENSLVSVAQGINFNFDNINLFNSEEIRATIIKYITNLLSQFQVTEEEKNEPYAYHYNYRFNDNSGFLFNYTNAYFKKVETLIMSFFKSVDSTALMSIIGEKFGDVINEDIKRTINDIIDETNTKTGMHTDKFDSKVNSEQDDKTHTINKVTNSGKDSHILHEEVSGNVGTQFEDSPLNGKDAVEIEFASEKSKTSNSSNTDNTNTINFGAIKDMEDDVVRDNDILVVKDDKMVKTKSDKDTKIGNNTTSDNTLNIKDTTIFQYKIDAYIEMMKRNPICEIFDPYISSVVYELNAIF